MSKIKDKLIEDFLATPIQVGERVKIPRNYKKGTETVTVIRTDSNGIYYDDYGTECFVSFNNVKRDTYYLGINPIPAKLWNSQLRTTAFDLVNMLGVLGFNTDKYNFDGYKSKHEIAPELNWNPIVVNSDGNPISYQRDLCWTLEQKQLLIESLYNQLDCGKMIIRKRSWDYVEKHKGNKNNAFKDIVDGKQRLNAITSFLMDEFEDLHGNLWSDLSNKAKNTILGSQLISYAELGEDATDADVLGVFLNVNFTGVQMSQEHIEFVKSIKL